MRARDKQLEVLYIGQRRGVEAGLAHTANLPFRGIEGGKLRRLPGAGFWRNLIQLDSMILNLRDSVLIAIGAIQAFWILRRYRPDVIFNKVGPAGIPVGIAAHILQIPMVIHEPDFTPGMANRILARWATRIAVGFPVKLYTAFPAAKLVYTGTPVQPAVLKGDHKRGRKNFGFSQKRPLILVVGGSQGAHSLNQAIMTVLPGLLWDTQVHHIVGSHDYRRLSRQAAHFEGYRVDEFLSVPEMADAYAAADIVIARGGANTIAELAALHKPTILVPNREAAAHQIQNAARLAEAGAALAISDEYPDELLAAVRQLLSSHTEQEHLAKGIAPFNVPEAATKLANLITEAVAK